MTTAAACALLVDAVRQTSYARAQRDGWRRVALTALDHIGALARELQMRDPCSAVFRLRAQRVRDDVDRQLAVDAEVTA